MSSKKTALWRGLTALFTFVLALSLVVGSIAEGYKATIDTALGTTSEVFVSDNTEDDPLYNKFTPSAEVLNEDGTGNSTALIQKAIDLNRQQAAEGAVLLKNNTENGQGLPLAEGSAVTLLGIRSHVSLIGSAFGVKAQGPYISLEQALSQNQTDFANTITRQQALNGNGSGDRTVSATMDGWTGEEFAFEGAGFTVNPVMPEIYETLNGTYTHAENEGPANVYDPGEPSIAEIEATNPDYASSFAEYGDAAIVVLGRPSAESTDYLPGGIAEGLGAEEPLALTTNELDAVELAKQASDNVIVLINSATPIEIGQLKNDPDVDAILWIGFPGCYGMLGVADILCGRTSPSGGLPDIYATYNMSAPAMQNMGNYFFTNSDVIQRGGGSLGNDAGSYIIEAEGLYTGYRYYETRYNDSVYGTGNATSPVGAYASTTEWNYTNEVAYGFGYGLSYTTFTQELQGAPTFDISTDPETGVTNAYATFNVKVTNTGSVPGKSSVQVYGQAPYTQGGLEKVAIQLLNFGKTQTLDPGASETVSVTVDLQYIASYDSEYDNGDGTFGTYVLDPGDYYFAVGNGAHDALNNILALQGADATKMDAPGNVAMACKQTIDENFISRTAFSISKTGEKISNQLEYSDWNYFQPGEVTYLTRSDWAGTFPKSYTDMTLTSQDMIDLFSGKYYTLKTDDDTSSILWDQDSDIMFYQMYDVDFDDPQWQTLLDKMSLEEAQYLATFGGPSIPGVESIGTVETYMTENTANGVAVNLNANKDPNAPWAIGSEDPNYNWHPEIFGNSPLVAASFNPQLMYDIGAFIGEESLFVGIPILWGPGLNTHRQSYNGRNGEYYSEDPVLAGVCAMEFAIGAQQYGLIAAPKHFAFNDQETNRSGVAPFMTEQRAREVELRAYQIAFEATKYDTAEEDNGMRGLMVSFSKIGPVECTCSVGLMTNILKNEWGFQGYAVTDIYDDMDLYTAVLASGTTCYDTRGMSGFYSTTTLDNNSRFANQVDGNTVSTHMLDGDATLQAAVKESAHNILYAMTQSHLMNRYNSTTRVEQAVTWWRVLYIGLAVVSGVILIASAALYVTSKRKESEVK